MKKLIFLILLVATTCQAQWTIGRRDFLPYFAQVYPAANFKCGNATTAGGSTTTVSYTPAATGNSLLVFGYNQINLSNVTDNKGDTYALTLTGGAGRVYFLKTIPSGLSSISLTIGSFNGVSYCFVEYSGVSRTGNAAYSATAGSMPNYTITQATQDPNNRIVTVFVNAGCFYGPLTNVVGTVIYSNLTCATPTLLQDNGSPSAGNVTISGTMNHSASGLAFMAWAVELRSM